MDLPSSELYECEGRIKVVTRNGGVLVERAEDGEEFWIPDGAIDDKSECYQKGDQGVILIERRLAVKKGMIDE
jgi:hypothetical protein